MIALYNKYKFLLEQLIIRDFKEKYKGTVLGILWSVLAPLLHLLILVMVFTRLLGRNTPHYSIYIFCGTLVRSYFKESTKKGMKSLVSNKSIISKIKMPKYLFLFSNNISCLINFCLTLIVFFILCLADNIKFKISFLLLIWPILCLTIFNIGVGLLLSASYVFFKDTGYLYEQVLTIVNYCSAIFYSIDKFPVRVQRLFLLNPLYVYIKYFRIIVIDGNIPSIQFNLLCLFYAVIFLLAGIFVYKKSNKKFIYYL